MEHLPNKDIIQVCIVVRDLDKTLDRYVEIFGVERPKINQVAPYEKAKTTYRGQPSNAQARLCAFQMGSVMLELTEPDGEPSVWQEFLDKHGEGVCYLGMWIGDEEETFHYLQEHGIGVMHTGKTMTGSYTCVDSTDALGVIFNLKYRRPDAQ